MSTILLATRDPRLQRGAGLPIQGSLQTGSAPDDPGRSTMRGEASPRSTGACYQPSHPCTFPVVRSKETDFDFAAS
jgi:hypothetical protein